MKKIYNRKKKSKEKTLKIIVKRQHRKSTLKINIENTKLKINIGNQHRKKNNVISTWPVVIIDQDALHAYSIYFIHSEVIRSS